MAKIFLNYRQPCSELNTYFHQNRLLTPLFIMLCAFKSFFFFVVSADNVISFEYKSEKVLLNSESITEASSPTNGVLSIAYCVDLIYGYARRKYKHRKCSTCVS